MRKFNAFTLAEVLITLGIIGVVAAMTMPTLINQTNGAQYKAAYKKALSAISQGVTLNVALDDQSFAENSAENILPKRMNVVKTEGAPSYTGAVKKTGALTFKYTCTTADVTKDGDTCKGKTAGAEVDKTIADTTVDKTLYFNDGSMFAFASGKNSCKSTAPCAGLIDVNGAKGPNKPISDANTPTDIYPVIYYDQTVLPGTDPAREVLYAK
jgi:prepilin-type N-terminal cleavage/methylation domain-containing protein